jgi:predicted nucleotide-binding protein (sugar kinase/HSP70/actin superfamily)
MGNVALAAGTLFQGLKIPYVLPEQNNKRTLEIGTRFAPEEICYPFKLVLANCISGIEQGADTILITGSCGPCRFGEYCELLMRLLREMGYRDLHFFVADLSHEIGWREFSRRMEFLTSESPVSASRKIKSLQNAFQVVSLCDRLDARACALAGYERERGQCRNILHEYKERIRQSGSPEERLCLRSG